MNNATDTIRELLRHSVKPVSAQNGFTNFECVHNGYTISVPVRVRMSPPCTTRNLMHGPKRYGSSTTGCWRGRNGSA